MDSNKDVLAKTEKKGSRSRRVCQRRGGAGAGEIPWNAREKKEQEQTVKKEQEQTVLNGRIR